LALTLNQRDKNFLKDCKAIRDISKLERVSRLGPTPELPIRNSFIHFREAEVPIPTPIYLKRSSTEPAEVSQPWDEDSVDVSIPPPAEVARQPKLCGRKDTRCFAFEHMASSLRSMDRSIVKKCNLEVGDFMITIAPKRTALKKGCSSFRASKGQCTAHVKCNSESKRELTIALRVGNSPAALTTRHDFSKCPVCNLTDVVDLKDVLDENASLFRLIFEFTIV
jgi:hypothetical protein